MTVGDQQSRPLTFFLGSQQRSNDIWHTRCVQSGDESMHGHVVQYGARPSTAQAQLEGHDTLMEQQMGIDEEGMSPDGKL
jgi:hypothetical protein